MWGSEYTALKSGKKLIVSIKMMIPNSLLFIFLPKIETLVEMLTQYVSELTLVNSLQERF